MAASTSSSSHNEPSENQVKTRDNCYDPGPTGHDEELKLDLALPVKIPSPLPESEQQNKDVIERDADETPPQVLRVEVHDHNSAETPESPTYTTPVEVSSHVTVIEIGSNATGSAPYDKGTVLNAESTLTSEEEQELMLLIENQEREKIIDQLNSSIEKELKTVERLQELLADATS